MSRRLRRDLHKRISSAGYQKISGDLEVTGALIGPSMANVVTAIMKIVAGTLTPVQLTISRCEGGYKSIILQWLVQYNLMNFDRYEVQVSSDESNWYSLEFDGSDWKDTLNADTDVVAPLIVHVPIPFGGTAENPTAVTLYYRMRQVTILGVASTWSATASDTTSLIQTGDLAANIVTANKILAGTITAAELAAGIITAREIAFSNNLYTSDVPIPSGAELFDLQQPDCVSHLGRMPAADKQIAYFPPSVKDEVDVSYDNDHVKWPGERGAIGIFKPAVNLASQDFTEWTNVNSADELSDYYINGHRFTKITAGAGFGYLRDSIVFTGDGIKSISIIAKKGDDTTNRILLVDDDVTDTKLDVEITWATRTVVIISGDGTLHRATWIGTEIVYVQAITLAVTAANDNQMRLYAVTNGKHAYFTAPQAEDNPYPTPFTPTSRPAGRLDYPLAMVNKFTLIFWVRPWFIYDIATFCTFIEWYLDGTHEFAIYYEAQDDMIEVWWRNGGAGWTLKSQLFDGSGDNNINQWIMVAVAIDLSAQGQTASRLKVYTALGSIGEDTDWDGVPNAFTDPFPKMSVGHLLGGNLADSLITDLLYVPNEVWTEAQLDAHYAANRPYFDPKELANEAQSVRINNAGLRMHNAGLTITDYKNRLIDISNRAGLKALDAGGQVIHDIPDAPVQTDMFWLGHINYFNDDTDFLIYTHLTAPEATWTSVVCELGGNTNVRGGLFRIFIQGVGTPVTNGFVWCVLRPKGSDWSFDYAVYPSPVLGNRVQLSVGTINSINHLGLLICPIGNDNSVDFYASFAPDDTQRKLQIVQLGVLV